MGPNIVSNFQHGVGTTRADSGLRVMPPPPTTAQAQLEAILSSVRGGRPAGGNYPPPSMTPGPQFRPAPMAPAAQSGPAPGMHPIFGEMPDENQDRWDIMNHPDSITYKPSGAGQAPGSAFLGWGY